MAGTKRLHLIILITYYIQQHFVVKLFLAFDDLSFCFMLIQMICMVKDFDRNSFVSELKPPGQKS